MQKPNTQIEAKLAHKHTHTYTSVQGASFALAIGSSSHFRWMVCAIKTRTNKKNVKKYMRVVRSAPV